jgi:hypothetical protein
MAAVYGYSDLGDLASKMDIKDTTDANGGSTAKGALIEDEEFGQEAGIEQLDNDLPAHACRYVTM